jgi:hypothetical protein
LGFFLALVLYFLNIIIMKAATRRQLCHRMTTNAAPPASGDGGNATPTLRLFLS